MLGGCGYGCGVVCYDLSGFMGYEKGTDNSEVRRIWGFGWRQDQRL